MKAKEKKNKVGTEIFMLFQSTEIKLFCYDELLICMWRSIKVAEILSGIRHK
jgi:hypothetical protein